jgi:cytochrome c oxidase subunit 2
MNEEPGPYHWLRTLLFLPPEASTVAQAVDHLHYFVIITTFVASTVIGFTAIYFVIHYARRSDDDPTPMVRSPWWFETLIVVVPLSFFLTWFAIGFHEYTNMVTPPAGAMDVYVTAKQWMWSFAYPDGPNGLEVLRVPVGRPVRLLMTSRDVIHSFYVPSFRIKRDVLPGRYTQTWFQAVAPGSYQILCAEFCGTGHSMMRGEVVAMEAGAFDAWMADVRRGLASRQDAPGPSPSFVATMSVEGRQLALKYECLRCHTVDGTPHIGPTWLGLYGRRERLADGHEVVIDEAYLTESMMDPMAKIVAGYKPLMPTFQGRIDGAEAAAIIEYIKTLVPEELQTGPSQGETYEPIPGR